MSFFINGIPMTIGPVFPVGSRFTALADGLRLCRGDAVVNAPALRGAVDTFLARVPRSESPFSEAQLFGSPDLWIGRKRGEEGWKLLDTLAQMVIDGDPATLPAIKRILDRGFIAEMKMAMEMKAGPLALDSGKRNRALLKLRDLELRFEVFRRDPRRVPGNKKRARIAPYLEISRQLETPIENHESRLNLLFDLVQIHEFIHRESGLLESFGGEYTPGTLTDLLNGELGETPVGGACLSLAVLVLHLGNRIGLPLESYYSEEHISIVAGGENGLIYEPSGTRWIFLPRDAYVRAFCAPEDEPTRGPLLAVLSFPWESLLTEDNGRFGEYIGFLTRNVAHDLWVHWYLLASYAGIEENYGLALQMIEKGLEFFPQCLSLWLKRVALSLTLNDVRNARKYLRQAKVISAEREKKGGLAEPADGDLRRIKRLEQELKVA